MKNYCECPYRSYRPEEDKHLYSPEEYIGMNHEPNQCKCTHNLREYIRDGKKITLCSCCVVFDAPVEYRDIPI